MGSWARSVGEDSTARPYAHGGLHLAVVGKGGAGKSVIAGTLARTFARRGARVLALDSDPMPGLASSLGATTPEDPPLLAAGERPEGGRWQVRKGIGPIRAIQLYTTPAPDGVLLLEAGKTPEEGGAAIQGATSSFYELVQRIRKTPSLQDWTLVGDLSAGPRQPSYRWADYANMFLLITEPNWKSGLAARRIARIIRDRGDVPIRLVANKITRRSDEQAVADMVREPVFTTVPADEAVAAAERAGVPLLDHAPSSPAALAIERLADRLSSGA